MFQTLRAGTRVEISRDTIGKRTLVKKGTKLEVHLTPVPDLQLAGPDRWPDPHTDLCVDLAWIDGQIHTQSHHRLGHLTHTGRIQQAWLVCAVLSSRSYPSGVRTGCALAEVMLKGAFRQGCSDSNRGCFLRTLAATLVKKQPLSL